MSTVFFPCAARLNSLPKECFPLTSDLNVIYKSSINRHLNCRLFLNRFLVYFNLFVLLFLVTPYLAMTVQPAIEWIPIEKKRIFNRYFWMSWCFYEIYSLIHQAFSKLRIGLKYLTRLHLRFSYLIKYRPQIKCSSIGSLNPIYSCGCDIE